jgi:hypothetical protein
MFPPLSVDVTNFLEWINDVKTVLSAENLARTLITPVASTSTVAANPADNILEVCKWQALLLL